MSVLSRAAFDSRLLLISVLICALLARKASPQSPLPQINAAPQEVISAMRLMTTSSGWVMKVRHLLWTDSAGKIWTDITPPLKANQIIGGVYFLDSEHGWALLKDSGVVSEVPQSPDSLLVSVAVTSNGGKSWSVASIPDDAPVLYTGGAFSFVDETRGWLLLGIQGSSASSAGKLFTTHDAGASWSALPYPPIAGSIQFFPDATGWLAGGVHQNELYRTADGGRTWAHKIISLPLDVHSYTIVGGDGNTYTMPVTYTGPHFSTEQKGIILVSVPVSEQSAPLLTYTTEDGGNTWQLQKADSEIGTRPAAPPAFFDSAYVEVGSPGGTSSGIASFRLNSEASEHTSTRLPNKHSVVNTAQFIDALHGWLLMSDHSLLGTADGGRHLTVLLQSDQVNPANGIATQQNFGTQDPEVIQPAIGGVAGVSAYGLDNCATVSPQILNSLYGSHGQAIYNQPNYYSVYGFYLGGVTSVSAGCTPVSASFITGTACAGWSYLPIWDGYQAPCTVGFTPTYPLTTVAAAASEGIGDADSARQQLLNIGLSGSIAYLNLEAYATNNASCSQLVQTYVSAWVGEMHQYRLYAGVYVSGSNTPDMNPGTPGFNVPDDIWVPNYNGQAVTTPLANVNNGWWADTQRSHQYYGGLQSANNPTYYAQTLIPNVSGQPNISAFDLDITNGAVAEMIDPPPSCDEGCTAACYNRTSQWCGSTCMNCVSCGANQQLSCVNGTTECTYTQAYCNGICAGGVPENFAEYPNGCSSSYFPDQDCCCYASPIVIDAFGEGFHLTNASGGVKFTTLPSAGLEQLSWTDAQWHNGWLALDRNGNGRIDDFTELFGNLTAQPPSNDENGYLALAVFDDPANGGNGNGFIDPDDSVYDHLLLWIDANHNGISEPEELHSLRDVGIFKIDLKFHDSSYTDVNGNRFRYEAKIWDTELPSPRKSYDVFLTIDTQQ